LEAISRRADLASARTRSRCQQPGVDLDQGNDRQFRFHRQVVVRHLDRTSLPSRTLMTKQLQSSGWPPPVASLEVFDIKYAIHNKLKTCVYAASIRVAALSCSFSAVNAQQPRPNIVFIMGDDIGWSNIGVYNQGIMSGRTPNLDKLASEGMRFTDYYAEASCTAGRANFITGELPIRTGLTTVGQAGSPLGIPDEAPTIANALKSMGYATGQFGKNHLGDRNQFLPTVHGFDEFYGYLYHLDAMEDPCHPNY